MEDKDVGDFETSSEVWTEKEIEELQNSNSPKTTGIMLIIFVSIVIVMIGGLAAYYYYNFQTQGNSYQRQLQGNWDEVVVSANELSNDFSSVISIEELSSNTRGGFQETVADNNRTLKDISYNLQSISGYPLSGSLIVAKMRGVLEDYLDYLREFQSVIEKSQDKLIDEVEDIDELLRLNDELSDSYNDLLIADQTKIIEASIPSEFFDIAPDVKKLVEDYLQDQEKQAEADNKLMSAAAMIVNKFMQSYIDKNADLMQSYLTKTAASEFNPGIVDDPIEIKKFEITGRVKFDDGRVEIKATITKETPDQSISTSMRKFVMLNENNQWLIDSWNIL